MFEDRGNCRGRGKEESETEKERGRGERGRERVKLNWILAIFMVARVQYNGIIYYDTCM